MGQTITFFPEGNAECVLLELNNGKRMLMDYANMHSSDSRYTDLTESLKNVDTFDVVMFTHPHDDHVKGAADFFYFNHAIKYRTGERAKIKELWISAAFFLDVNPCEDARVIRQEARYRLKECGGKGEKSSPPQAPLPRGWRRMNYRPTKMTIQLSMPGPYWIVHSMTWVTRFLSLSMPRFLKMPRMRIIEMTHPS